MKTFQKAIFGFIVAVILIVVSIRVSFMILGYRDHLYEIIVPQGNDTPNYYYTNEYTESGECIRFKDEFGRDINISDHERRV